MKIVELEEVCEEKEVVKQISCDFCGKIIKNNGFVELKASAEYGSIHDMTNLVIDVCDNCYTNFLEEKKIPNDWGL